MTVKSPHIAVVGAGIAGLACAGELAASGLRVTVFDKGRGVSGRASTRRGEHWQCDHGAQYFTAREPVFRAEVARWIAAGAAAPWQPRLAHLDAEGLTLLTKSVDRFVGTPRMTAPAAWLAAPLAPRLDTQITRVARDGARWRLHDQHGVIDAAFDGVVLAVPAPQAAPLLGEIAPALASLAAGVPIQPCWAVMLQYDARVEVGFDGAFVETGPLGWIARDSAKPGRGGSESWLLHASAAWSATHLEDDAHTVAEALTAAFMALGAPRPLAAIAHRWRYAKAPAREEVCLWDAGRRIGLCGDWLASGSVEGAWLSGRALAHRIAGAD